MTNVTLRKANELERGLIAAASKIEFERTIQVSIHRDETVTDLVKSAQASLNQNVATAVALVRAAHVIRQAISKANADHGINDLLGEKAALDAEEKVINQVVSGVSDARRARYGDDLNSASDPAVAQKQLDAARVRAATADRHTLEEVSVRVLDAATVATLTAELANIQLRKRAIADELLSANMTTKVTLESETVNLLKQIKLLA